jgi:hypothetical protein
MSLRLASPPEPIRPRQLSPRERSLKSPNTKFRAAILAVVNDLDQNSTRPCSIPQICRRHQIKRRRLYDVINVFIAIGCATRGGLDDLIWRGRDYIFSELRRAMADTDIHNMSLSLSALFPVDNCVGLTSLTVSFILLFPAMQTDLMDLRHVSCFFSRETSRYKTTLCKLYQISLILGAMRITERTENVCEVRLLPPFTDLLRKQEDESPLGIANLLNRPSRDSPIERRRKEYQTHANQQAMGD